VFVRELVQGVVDSDVRHPYIANQNSNTARKDVNSRPHSTGFKRSRALARVLSCLLLGLIFYGATVEAAHRHSGLRSRDISGASSLAHSDDSDLQGAGLTGCSDCLICQLHQSFSVPAIMFRGPNLPAEVSARFSQASPSKFGSQLSTAQSGRAPPFIS
jgi:hypothetical protein